MPLESGIAVTIKGFVPTDKADLKAQRLALDAVIAAQESGDLTKLADVMTIESIKADPVNRHARPDATAE